MTTATTGHAQRADLLLPVRGWPRPADREGDGRRCHRGRAQLLRRRHPPGRRQGLRQGLRAGAEDLQPEPRADADEAHEPEEGARPGPGLRADLVGRGLRADRRASCNAVRAEGLTDASGYPRVAASFGGAGTPQSYMGTLPGVPRRLGPDRHGLRLRPGRQVLPLRAPVRRVLAPRVHRHARHAAVQLPHLLRLQHRGLGRRDRRLAPCQCARARHEAGAGRAAPVGDRRLLGAVGADQAQDRRRVPVRADPRAAARGAARTARPAVPGAAHGLALPRRAARLLPARPRQPQAAGVGRGQRKRPACTTARGCRKRSKAATRSMRSRSDPTATCWPTACCRQHRLHAPGRAHAPVLARSGRQAICDVPAATCAASPTSSSTTPASARRSTSTAKRCPTARWR